MRKIDFVFPFSPSPDGILSCKGILFGGRLGTRNLVVIGQIFGWNFHPNRFLLLYIFAAFAKCLPVVGLSRDFLSDLSSAGIIGGQTLVAIATKKVLFFSLTLCYWIFPFVKRAWRAATGGRYMGVHCSFDFLGGSFLSEEVQNGVR